MAGVDQDDGAVVGACLGTTAGGSDWIGSLGVRRHWRGQGLGLALVQRLFHEYQRQGIEKVELSVDAANPAGAPRLYQRAGMAVE